MYQSNQFLSESYLRQRVPSIFSESVSDHLSDRYTQIPTWQIMQRLQGEGFMPVKAWQSASRKGERELMKHCVRFRHVDTKPDAKGLYPEMVLINSHDGKSAYKLMAGIYRLVCSNGLIAWCKEDEIRVRHSGDIIGNVIEGTYSVIDTSKIMLEHADNMAGIELSRPEMEILADAAHTLRFPNEGTKDKEGRIIQSGIKPDQMLRPKRAADANKNDLWTTFNVIQENVIRGGQHGYVRDANNRLRNTTTREVQAIDKNTSLNRALWQLAEKMAELKS